MRENHSLEFKQTITNTFLKTVSAFANFDGGMILFGVDDDGNSVGIPDSDSARLDIENRINDSISPKPDYTLSVNRRSNVVKLTVSEGKNKPYFYKGKAYRRSDTATVEVDHVELKRLILEGSNLYYEQLPYDSDDLSFHYFESALIEKLHIQHLNDDILRTFGFINEDKKYTNAAALFADKNDFYGIDIARFGDSISEILDRETVAGVSVLEQYDRAVSVYRRYYQYEVIEGVERKTVELIPEEAFREAVANALVHREWDVNSHIRISMFSDRIEIISPGGLPKGITREEYLDGRISNLRNPMVGNVFFRLHYIEMFGTGIKRIKDAYADAYLQPDFAVTAHTIGVTLPCTDRKPAVTSDEQMLLESLDTGMLLSSKEIAERLGWTKAKTVRVLNLLLQEKLIVKSGQARGTKYRRRT